MARSVVSGNRRSVGREGRQALQVEGLKELQEKLASLIDIDSARELKEIFLDGGKLIRDEARTRAPYDPKRKKGTHLREAIFVGRGDESKPNVLIGVRYKAPGGAPHAHIIEYGSADHEAQPFMRPAIAAAGPKAAARVRDGLVKAISDRLK